MGAVDIAGPTFEPFGKIPRLNRDITITEKIDGTNGVIYIGEDGQVVAGSRNRWVFPGKGTDNFGFASWVSDNSGELQRLLGPGRHYGEWFGRGIGRGYGLTERGFALFNTARWNPASIPGNFIGLTYVPTIYTGPFDTRLVQSALNFLRAFGSIMVPGYLNPEGVVVYHSAANTYFKVTVEGDEMAKTQRVGL